MNFVKRKIFLSLALISVAFVAGCASINDDPRNSYRPELWWLGASNPTQASWPAAEIADLPPMPVESIPARGQSPSANERTTNWPPIIEPPEKP